MLSASSESARTQKILGRQSKIGRSQRGPLLDFLVVGMAEHLERTTGEDAAASYVDEVAAQLGETLKNEHWDTLSPGAVTLEDLSTILVDIKNREGGAFYVIEATDDHILLGNAECPFGSAVHGQAALCRMTSRTLQTITASTFPDAVVELRDTIAGGASECRILIRLTPSSGNDGGVGPIDRV